MQMTSSATFAKRVCASAAGRWNLTVDDGVVLRTVDTATFVLQKLINIKDNKKIGKNRFVTIDKLKRLVSVHHGQNCWQFMIVKPVLVFVSSSYLRLQIIPESMVLSYFVFHCCIFVELHSKLATPSDPGTEHSPSHTHHNFNRHQEYEEAGMLKTK